MMIIYLRPDKCVTYLINALNICHVGFLELGHAQHDNETYKNIGQRNHRRFGFPKVHNVV